MHRTILHVDMDAFFASVEALDDPSLRGRPVLVGGAGARGVVAAASYEARVFGCRSAQPTAVALRRCPDAVVVAPRMERYREVSREVFARFERVTPLVEPLSIDEAFLDVTASRSLFGEGPAIARALRAEVLEATGLTCSVGVAAVKFVAKIASGHDKPDGMTVVPAGGEQDFLGPLPVGRLWGVGPKTLERLTSMGLRTVADLRQVERTRLERAFGEHGERLFRLARGIDDRAVEPGRRRVQISHEDTFPEDLTRNEEVEASLLAQATAVADRLIRGGRRGRVVFIKIRDGDFNTVTRQRTLERPTALARVIYEAAREMFLGLKIPHLSIRLTGVGVSGLVDEEGPGQQLELQLGGGVDGEGTPATARGETLQQTLTAVRTRFGEAALAPAGSRSVRRAQGGKATSRRLDEDE